MWASPSRQGAQHRFQASEVTRGAAWRTAVAQYLWHLVGSPLRQTRKAWSPVLPRLIPHRTGRITMRRMATAVSRIASPHSFEETGGTPGEPSPSEPQPRRSRPVQHHGPELLCPHGHDGGAHGSGQKDYAQESNTCREGLARAGAAAIASMCFTTRGVAGTSKPCGLMNVDEPSCTLTRRVRVGEQCRKLIQMRVEIAGQVQQPPRRASR